ncbi:MAG: efflux RND transporter periplasmic adaptor subunit, partial [Planctomycetales bacterium]
RSRDASALALEGAEFTLPASLTEKNLALEKLRVGHRKTEQKLERMKKDRTELIVRAPSAGVVYYGQAVRGKWPDATASGKTLIKGAAVKPKQVLMTIVNNDKLFVRATLEEKQLSEVRRGDKALIISKAFPSTRLRGTVRDISSIPIAPGKFDAVVDYSSNKDARQLVAGMTCEVVVDVYSKSNAILVPKTAVDLDEDGSRGFVYLVGDKDKQKKQRVRVGRTVNKRLEILSGLKADDKILINNPD